MKHKKLSRKGVTAAFMGTVLALLSMVQGAAVTCAQADEQGVILEKSAAWESAADYRAKINLKANGIQKFTQKEVPISVVPILDVTESMQACDTRGHVKQIFSHPFSAFEGSSEIWKDLIVPLLPTPDEYGKLGQADADEMLLALPKELDPSGKCRIAYQKGREEQRDYYGMYHWRVFYVKGDDELLKPLRDGYSGNYDFRHTILRNGVYLPVGAAEESGGYAVWAYASGKEPGHGCASSGYEHLVEGYSEFVQALFENPGAQICPAAFVGGYYINGWTQDAQEAIDFIAQKEYEHKEQVLPDHNSGTNHEAAIAAAMDAVNRLETTENTFAILFTDGDTSSGYDHTSGKADTSRLDSHSAGLPGQDSSWYSTYADWAVQDAAVLKERAAVYTAGYGTKLELESSFETLQKISSGSGYFIDSRSESIQSISDIFRVIYSDLILKATKMHIVDYISEYWDIEEAGLPKGCTVETVSITNQKGQPDTIYKVTYPITREMGEDDQEELQIPVVLREEYRDPEEKKLYETNQDAPLNKDQEGTGGYVSYVGLEGQDEETSAETPLLDVYPSQPDFLLEKKALDPEAQAGGTARFEFRLVNCGQAELRDLVLEDAFDREGVVLLFDQAQGIVLENQGTSVRVEKLGLGEERILTGTAEIPKDAKGVYENTVTGTAPNPKDPENPIKKEAKDKVTVLPGPSQSPEPSPETDFEVEKTVDKEKASPGETLTYQIRIAKCDKKAA